MQPFFDLTTSTITVSDELTRVTPFYDFLLLASLSIEKTLSFFSLSRFQLEQVLRSLRVELPQITLRDQPLQPSFGFSHASVH